MQCTVYSEQYTVDSVQYIVYSTMSGVQCTVNSLQLSVVHVVDIMRPGNSHNQNVMSQMSPCYTTLVLNVPILLLTLSQIYPC